MSSKTFDGVWFISLPGVMVGRSGRTDAVTPQNAKRSDVRRILKVASVHAAELHKLWETMNGPAY